MPVLHPTQINRHDFKALDRRENGDFKSTFGRGEVQYCANLFGRLISYCALVACMTDFAWSRFTFYLPTKFYTDKMSGLTLCFSSKVTAHLYVAMHLYHSRGYYVYNFCVSVQVF